MAGTEVADPTFGTGGGALGAVDRFVHRIEKFTALLSGFGVFALMMLGVAQVLLRKFFNIPIYGYIDLVEIMMSFLVFMALAYTERLGGHIRMELILTFLPKRLVNLFEVIGVLVGLFVVGVLTYYTMTHAWRSYTSGDSTMDAQIALWPSKLIVSLSLGLLFVRLLIALWGYTRLIITPDATPYGVPELVDMQEQARRDAVATEALVTEQPAGRP